MKKILLITFTVGQVWAVSAQNINASEEVRVNQERLLEKQQPSDQGKVTRINGEVKNNKNFAEKILGLTKYDLQTNATVHDRIAMNSSGRISVAWTASEENSTSFSDRGTGYSTFDPTSGSWTLSPDYPRIESDRCGWPSILYDANGGEIIISHSTDASVLRINTRSSIGTGNWSEKDINAQQFTWNRATIGGANGNTVHIIASTDADDSAMYQSMTSALVYFRSQDGGQTFDINAQLLPDMDSAHFGSGVSNDAYAITAKGDHIAIAQFNSFNNVMLYESMNNGTTWTPIVVATFPYKGFEDFDKQVDTNFYVTSDGSGSILIDDQDVVHLTWGRMQASMGDTPMDGFYSRRFYTDSLFYYRNSTSPLFKVISHYIDPLNDGFNISKFSDYGYGSVMTMPNMSVGTDGTIYLVYSSANDTIRSATDDATNMRNLYLMKSTDHGDTWTEPLNITYAPGNWTTTECVYPDLAPSVDNKIRILYHRDNLPAGYVRQLGNTGAPSTSVTWQTSISNNEVVFYTLDKSLNIGIEQVLNSVSESGVYPNPSDGHVNLTVCVLKNVDVNISVTSMNGQVVHTYNGQKLILGPNKIDMDLSSLGSGVYFINIQAGEGLLTEKVILK